jgi:hypothetical protein
MRCYGKQNVSAIERTVEASLPLDDEIHEGFQPLLEFSIAHYLVGSRSFEP